MQICSCNLGAEAYENKMTKTMELNGTMEYPGKGPKRIPTPAQQKRDVQPASVKGIANRTSQELREMS